MKVNIRKLTIKELSALKIFHAGCVCHYNISDTSFINYFMFPQYVVMAAVGVNSVILGYIICFVVIDKADIIYLYVDEKNRYRGIATQIFECFVSSICNLKKVYLEVNVNNVEAISFYKKKGFKIIRIRKMYSNGEDAYEMMCKVNKSI
jgi:ribosomal protein S18 acetylase RimI-like enzyme